MTYTEFQTAIQQWLENYEASFVANMPVFFRNAEMRVYGTINPPTVQQETVGATFSIGTATIAKPTGYRSANGFRYTDGAGRTVYLTQKDPTFLREAFPTGTNGPPRFYADMNETQLLVAPAPDNTYAYVLSYNALPQSITVAGTGRTWLGDTYEQLLLYAALVEAATFMKEEQDVIANYDKMYLDALATTTGVVNKLARQDSYRKGRVKANNPPREAE